MQLSETNFFQYILHHYDNPACKSLKEFEDDIARISHIKKLLGRIYRGKKVKNRLLINHLIILNNVFSTDVLKSILLFKIDNKYHYILKSFMIPLNIYDNMDDGIDIDMTIFNDIMKEIGKD